MKSRYDSNPEPRKKAMESWYASKDESHKRSRYTSNPVPKRMAMNQGIPVTQSLKELL